MSIGSVVATLTNSVLLMISSASVATFVAHASVSPADNPTPKGAIGTAAAVRGSGCCASALRRRICSAAFSDSSTSSHDGSSSGQSSSSVVGRALGAFPHLEGLSSSSLSLSLHPPGTSSTTDPGSGPLDSSTPWSSSTIAPHSAGLGPASCAPATTTPSPRANSFRRRARIFLALFLDGLTTPEARPGSWSHGPLTGSTFLCL